VPSGQQWKKFAEETEERDHGNSYCISIYSTNVKKPVISDSLIDLVELFVHTPAITRCRRRFAMPACFFSIFWYPYAIPQLNSYAAIPAICSILPFPAIGFPMDDGPDILSDCPVSHGSAAGAFRVRGRPGTRS
jgi:hypothetical protein